MPGDESFESKYERLKRQLQESILTEYPNPNRVGCPGEPVVRGLAQRYLDRTVQDEPSWQHVTRCSPCYREFLDARAEMKGAADSRRRVRVGLGLALAGVIFGGVAIYVSRGSGLNHPGRLQNAEVGWQVQRVDLSKYAPTRSTDAGQQDQTVIRLRPVPTDLVIELPFGSGRGEYEVQVGRGEEILTSGKGRETSGLIEIHIDLSNARGAQWIRVRRQGSGWQPLALRVSD
jgi:hypothetical protein